jgi:hypothetical protein
MSINDWITLGVALYFLAILVIMAFMHGRRNITITIDLESQPMEYSLDEYERLTRRLATMPCSTPQDREAFNLGLQKARDMSQHLSRGMENTFTESEAAQ